LRPFGLAIADIENELLIGEIVILPTNGRKNGLRLTAIDHAQVADNHQVSDRLGAVQGTEGKGSSRPGPEHVPARLKVNGASVKKTSIVGVKKSQLWAGGDTSGKALDLSSSSFWTRSVISIVFPPEIGTSIGRFPLTKEVFKEILAYRAT
jgi:hypothetical protein